MSFPWNSWFYPPLDLASHLLCKVCVITNVTREASITHLTYLACRVMQRIKVQCGDDTQRNLNLCLRNAEHIIVLTLTKLDFWIATSGNPTPSTYFLCLVLYCPGQACLGRSGCLLMVQYCMVHSTIRYIFATIKLIQKVFFWQVWNKFYLNSAPKIF